MIGSLGGKSMKIIIVGAGKVGKTIAESLISENHDLIIVDNDIDVLNDVLNIYDVKGVLGNGASYDVLVEAQAESSDLLIACTSSDELNILSCLISKKIGTKHTIARVRNPEYNRQVGMINEELGISLIVNPELEAAKEIARILRSPAAQRIESFAGGVVDMVELKVDSKSVLKDKSLVEIRKELDVNFLVCAVERNGEANIPNGAFIINENDRIHVLASNTDIYKLYQKLDLLKYRVKSVMIIGGSKVGFYLAKQLSELHYSVKVIEKDERRCVELSELLTHVDIVHGDSSDQEILHEEGIESVDALVSLTGLDEENLIISLYASILKVPKVITKINRYNYSNILERIGLDTIITPKDITANQIICYVRSLYEARSTNVITLYRILNNQVEASEFHISKETNYTSIPLQDLNIKKNILVACIIRNNKVIIPSGNDTLEKHDSVIIVSKDYYLSEIEDILG